MAHYMPKGATIAQACNWLAKQTGEPWTLARILEAGAMPWFWLDYSDGYGADVFCGRTEGYFAPMAFAGDSRRLEIVDGAAMVTMTRTPDDKLLRIEPPMPVALDDLRFKGEDIKSIALDIQEARRRSRTPVKWHVWLNAHHVMVWEAVALVCNIEPTSLKVGPRGWMDRIGAGPYFEESSFPSTRVRQGFDDALLLAERAANASGPITLSVGLASGMNKRRAMVSLAEVAAYFVQSNWPDLPNELTSLVSNFANAKNGQKVISAQDSDLPAEGLQPTNGPPPLSTSQVALCFDGLRYTAERWKKPLGDKPKWLEACVAMPGKQGVRETLWNPVLIGAALVRDGHVKANSVRARFQTKQALQAWLDKWKTYEADYFDSD